MTEQQMGDHLYTTLTQLASALEVHKWTFLRYAHNYPEYSSLCKDIAEVFDMASYDSRALLQEFLLT